MNKIIGINANHADSSACILINGRLEFAIEEERINRIKHWAGFPKNSIEMCLTKTNIESDEINHVAINTNPLSNFKKKLLYFLKNYSFGKKKTEIINRNKKKILIKKEFEKNFILNKKIKFHYIDHHLSHIASAYFPSNYDNAIGLSLDGFGDFSSLAIAKCQNKNIQIIKRIFFPHSLGLFYESITQFLGFKNYGEEYKVMALSSLGHPEYYDLIKKNIFINQDIYSLNMQYFNHANDNFRYNFKGSPNQPTIYSKKFIELFGSNIEFNKYNITERQKNIASSAQKIFEEYLENIIKEYSEKTGFKNLVYAGGCALNSLSNGRILEKKIIKNIYIPFAPGDSGGSIGAALIINNKLNLSEINNYNLTSPYLGNSYTNKEIAVFLKKYKKKITINYYENTDDLISKVTEFLIKDKIIGWFQDRMEFGARALGNRSIIANPCKKYMQELINKKIKRRENFRPFAPSILIEEKKNWFQNKSANPYMSMVETILPKKRRFVPAVVHLDGTGRVQTVSKKSNIKFYKLIKNFYSITKVPILLNTSFNENEPIVFTLKNAMDCFLRTQMDILVLNNFIIKKIK